MARLLFNMAYPGYLRHYGRVVLALADRGHEVLLAYDKAKGVVGERPLPVGAPANVRAIGNVPEHAEPFRSFLIGLGCTVDYVRFLAPDVGTPYLRQRMARFLPSRLSRLGSVERCPGWMVRLLVRLANVGEALVPVDTGLVHYLRAVAPDALMVTPLVTRGPSGVQQTQLVKAARQLRIPVAVGIGSWDHLSSKGLIRVQPDRVIVWNEIQKREATALHRVPPERVVVTGAQAFDGWFGRRPSLSRAEFLNRVGLPPDRPMVLYVGSSRGIAGPELEVPFVKDWIASIRQSDDPALRELSVLVRPHYSNMDAWSDTDLAADNVSIYPRQRPALPMTDLDADDYFHSMYFSGAVVGINTSAMIEATIIGRPVHTVETPALAATQAGTVHFHYLVGSQGCVESAGSFDEHLRQLAGSLSAPDATAARRRRFVERFVRPNGVDRMAVDYVADAVEGLVRGRTAPTIAREAEPAQVATRVR
jgi:hypothetical protein